MELLEKINKYLNEASSKLKKITKNEFKQLHKGNNLLLVKTGLLPRTKEEIIKQIDKALKSNQDIKDMAVPTSNFGNLSTSRDKSTIINIYKYEKDGIIFILVEEINDFSLQNDTSRSDSETNTILYMLQ